MEQLARKLRALDYFTLGFGTMVGVGWLVVMDDWLTRGGPLGALLGFGLGGAALVPVAYVYGRLATELPQAGSEMAYAEHGFGPRAGFAAGWLMALTYLVVCPWEAVAIGKLVSWIFPGLSTLELYRVAGKPVYLPHLALGLGLTALLTFINHRGVRNSATFQNWTTLGLLALFVVFASAGVTHGSAAHLTPLFGEKGAWVSTLLVLQIVPYFLVGFESVPKGAEEAQLDFRARGFTGVILLALGVGIFFYATIVGVVAWISPWQSLVKERFATAVAFERALGSRWIVDVIFAAALLSLFKVFNGSFMAASRMLFALGRRGMVDGRLGRVHPQHQTPFVAVLCVGAVTAVGALLGEALLIPVTEVGSLTAAVGWFAACAAWWRLRPEPAQRAVSLAGMTVAGLMLAMKVLPFVPGHFSVAEFAVLAGWIGLGLILSRRARSHSQAEPLRPG
jgi:APA family basic amino acid/polyamine antiporter